MLISKKRCNSRKAWTSHTKETDNYTIDTNWTVNPYWQTLSKHTFNYNDILVRSEMTKCKLADSWTLPTKYLSILRCLSLQTFKIFMKQLPFLTKNMADILLVSNILEWENAIFGRKPFLFLNINAAHIL